MARISEILYRNTVSTNTGVGEFVEVALSPDEYANLADYTFTYYQQNGTVAQNGAAEYSLDQVPADYVTFDADANEYVFVFSEDWTNERLTADTNTNSSEGMALTNTATGTVEDFYEIGAGSDITASEGAAAGATSTHLAETNQQSMQWNQPDPDTMVEGDLSYLDTGTGNAVCFTAGMKLETPEGAVAVEALEIGDLVNTMDNGAQPIRFIYRRKMKATAKTKPVRFEIGVIGNDEVVIVSPKHRFFTGALPDEMRMNKVCGDQDGLVHADQLVNGSTIRFMNEVDEVEYFHIMFDQHELVYCHGTISESWHPLRRNIKRDKALRKELLEIFPEINHKTQKTRHWFARMRRLAARFAHSPLGETKLTAKQKSGRAMRGLFFAGTYA